jgi:hypothetical protein
MVRVCEKKVLVFFFFFGKVFSGELGLESRQQQPSFKGRKKKKKRPRLKKKKKKKLRQREKFEQFCPKPT